MSLRTPLLRHSACLTARRIPRHAVRPLATTAARSKDSDQGGFSRTDKSIRIDYPPLRDHPPSTPLDDRGGPHVQRTLPTFSLEGRVGVVTGGARGLGLVMAQALVVSGADVALVDLTKDEGEKQAAELVAKYREQNPDSDRVPNVTAHYCDVADPTSVQTALDEIVATHGRVDHLVTSAGFTENYAAVDYPIERVRRLWSVNVDGTYLWATAVARHLLDRQAPGSMVLIASMSGAIVNVPQPQAPYNASKAAVKHLASSLAVEWASAGIRVNALSPGYMRTALTAKIIKENPDMYEKWMSLIPVGRMGVPEDLMGAVVFLLSDAAGYVNGTELRVDGAYTVT